MADPNAPLADPDSRLPAADPGPPIPGRPTAHGGSSAGRVALIVIPIVLLAALIGFGWALNWHEPLFSAFKPALAPARGRILYKGEPVTVGHVQTFPISSMNETALGGLGPDGTFELTTNGVKGAGVGEHRLMVLAMTSDFPPKAITPARYQQAATTPLRIMVTEDASKNVFEFELTDDAN